METTDPERAVETRGAVSGDPSGLGIRVGAPGAPARGDRVRPRNEAGVGGRGPGLSPQGHRTPLRTVPPAPGGPQAARGHGAQPLRDDVGRSRLRSGANGPPGGANAPAQHCCFNFKHFTSADVMRVVRRAWPWPSEATTTCPKNVSFQISPSWPVRRVCHLQLCAPYKRWDDRTRGNKRFQFNRLTRNASAATRTVLKCVSFPRTHPAPARE